MGQWTNYNVMTYTCTLECGKFRKIFSRKDWSDCTAGENMNIK